MFPIVGTVKHAVKLAALDGKWQQKKESGSIFHKELTPQERQLEIFKEDMQKMREGDVMSSLTSKLKSGADLTPEEIEYLQKNAPEMYQEYVKMKQEKEAYERQLKNCKTKEDVDRLKMNKMGSLLAEVKSVTNNPNIPKGKKLELAERILMRTMGIQDIHMKFVGSGQYEALPSEEELREEERRQSEKAEEAARGLGDCGQEEIEESEIENEQEAVEESAQPNETAEAITDDTKKRKPVTSVTKDKTTDAKEEIRGNFCSAELTFTEVKAQIVQIMKVNGFTGIGHEYTK